jgi:DNA-binding transcriptional MerR regulator
MKYDIHTLARLSDVSVRTLHHYDAIGVLVPPRDPANGYRSYGENELLRLQQILFFKELGFSLLRIKMILDDPDFDLLHALREHRRALVAERARMQKLIHTLDDTVEKITKRKQMKDEELYDGFSKEEAKRISVEAKERWGKTDAYKESMKRMRNMTKEQMDQVKLEAEEIVKDMARLFGHDSSSREVQEVIGRHYAHLGRFYTPTPEIYRGLADMYIADPRFTAYYEKFHPGLAQFMSAAMRYYADRIAKNRA